MTCASLTTNGTNSLATLLFGSTITLHLRVNISLSPKDSGFFVLRKDGDLFNRSNINVTVLDNKTIIYHLYDAQPTDSGVYQAEYIGTHPILFTNELFIIVTSLNPSSTMSELHPTMINSKLYRHNTHTHTHIAL